MVNSKLRRHKVMERAIKAVMSGNLPPKFKYKDTYESIELPQGYTIPSQQDIEDKFEELLAEEESEPKTAILGDLEVGTANLYVDTMTSNVGIGTSTPGYTLDVHGNANVGTLTATTIAGDGSALSGIQSSNVSDFASNVTRIASVETDLTSNANRIGNLETDLTSNANRIENLETDLTSNANRIASVETDLTSNANRIASVETDLTSNANRIGNLETDMTSNANRMASVETDLTSNANRIGNLETDLTSNANRIASVETDLTSNANRIASVETDLTSNANRIASVETDLTSNANRIASVETDLTSNANRIGNLETDLTSNANRIASVETDLTSNANRIASVESGEHTFTGIKTFENDIVFESNLRIQGDLLVANTINMTVSDPVLELGSNNQNTGDIGLVMTRHGTTNSNVAIFFDESADVLKLGYTLNGANDSTLELDSNALAVNIQGALTAASLSGDGSGLTSLNAGNISSGKIDNTRLNEASTTGAGIVQLSDSTNGTSTTTAATESAVKAAYDRSSWGTGTFSDVLKLGGGSATGDANVEDANRTNTYIRFGEAGTGTDWAYLRQIGGNNAIKLALDFHDDNEARFEIRKVNSSSGTGAGEVATTVFSVDDGALTATTGAFSDALTATTGTFSDALTATTGTFTGDVRIPTLSTSVIGKISPVYLRGAGSNNAANNLVKIGNTTVVNGSARGLTLTIITASTHAHVSSTAYDTYGSTGASDLLATALEGLTDDQIGILTSYDAYAAKITSDLQSVAHKLGLTRLASSRGVASRHCYASIFYGLGASTISGNHAIEVYKGNDASGAYATLSTFLVDDSFCGQTVSNALYSGESNDTTPSVLVNNSGNVGIGTTSPSAKLHISSGTSGDCVLKLQADTDNNNEADNPRIEFITDGAYNTAMIGAGQMPFDTSNYNSLVLAALTMRFYTGVQDFTDETGMLERMIINDDGNVGIGTSSPISTLQVNYTEGTIADYAYGSSSTSWYNKGLGIKGGTGGFIYGHDINHSIFLRRSPNGGNNDHNAYCNPGFHAFYTGGYIESQTEKMRIQSNGDVGIGTTSPGYKLDVNGTVNTGALTATSGTFSGNVTTGPNIYVGTNTNNETAKTIYFGGTYGDNSYDHCVIERRVYTTGTEKQELLLFSGNDGETSAGPDRIRLKGAQILFDTLNSSTDRTTENTKMIIKAGGNVGIGTTSPGYKLDVNGTVNTGALTATTGTFSGALTATSEVLKLSSGTGTSNAVALSIQNFSSSYTEIENGFGSRIQFRTNRGTSGGSTSQSAEIKGYIYGGAGGSGDYHALDLDAYGDNGSFSRGISIYGKGNGTSILPAD